MWKKTIFKIVLLFLGLILVNILLLHKRFLGLLSSESNLIITLGIMLFLLSGFVFVFIVRKIIYKDIEANVKGKKAINLEERLDKIDQYKIELIDYKRKNVGNVKLEEIIEKVVRQIDSINAKQDKLLRILKRNDAEYDAIMKVGEETEKKLENNIRIILNRIDILSERDDFTSNTEKVFKEQIEVINDISSYNDDILYQFDMLLDRAAEINGDAIKNDEDINAIMSVMEEMFKRKILGGEQDE